MVDESLPVNWKKGVEMFGEEGLMSALNDFEPFSFDKKMKELAMAFHDEDWLEVKQNADSIKETSLYIAADRFSNLCWILQNAAMKQPAADVNEIHEAYENVLMEGRLLKIHLAKLLNKAPDTSEIDSYQAS